jgi:hypothetical protein
MDEFSLWLGKSIGSFRSGSVTNGLLLLIFIFMLASFIIPMIKHVKKKKNKK